MMCCHAAPTALETGAQDVEVALHTLTRGPVSFGKQSLAPALGAHIAQALGGRTVASNVFKE